MEICATRDQAKNAPVIFFSEYLVGLDSQVCYGWIEVGHHVAYYTARINLRFFAIESIIGYSSLPDGDPYEY
jgi:hypothetical protein